MAGLNNMNPIHISDAEDDMEANEVPVAAAVPGGYHAMVLASQLAKGLDKMNRLEKDRKEVIRMDRKRELINAKVEAAENDPEIIGFQEGFAQLLLEPELYVGYHQAKDAIAICEYGYPGIVYHTEPRAGKALERKGIHSEPVPPQ